MQTRQPSPWQPGFAVQRPILPSAKVQRSPSCAQPFGEVEGEDAVEEEDEVDVEEEDGGQASEASERSASAHASARRPGMDIV
jgi:hypothetical protein